MKKLIRWISVMALTLSISLTAFALPSPTVSGFVKGVKQAIDANKAAVEIVVKLVAEADFTEIEKAAVEEIKNIEKIKEILGDAWKDGMQLVDIRNVEIIGDESLVVYPVNITFDVPGVTEESDVALLHFTEEAGEWEVIECEAGDGTIDSVFNSLSPVAFIVDANTAKAMESNVTSPKTGQPDLPIWAGLAVVAVLGGAVVCINRKGKVLSE